MQGHSRITDTTMRQKGYLLVAEAARKINVAPQTIYRWISDGKVDGFREGYRRFVRWSAVLRHLGKEACAARDLTQESIWVENAGT